MIKVTINKINKIKNLNPKKKNVFTLTFIIYHKTHIFSDFNLIKLEQLFKNINIVQ